MVSQLSALSHAGTSTADNSRNVTSSNARGSWHFSTFMFTPSNPRLSLNRHDFSRAASGQNIRGLQPVKGNASVAFRVSATGFAAEGITTYLIRTSGTRNLFTPAIPDRRESSRGPFNSEDLPLPSNFLEIGSTSAALSTRATRALCIPHHVLHGLGNAACPRLGIAIVENPQQ